MGWVQPTDTVLENLDQYKSTEIHRFCSELLHNDGGHTGTKATLDPGHLEIAHSVESQSPPSLTYLQAAQWHESKDDSLGAMTQC